MHTTTNYISRSGGEVRPVPADTALLAATACSFMYCCLWPGRRFGAAVETAARQQIQRLLWGQSDPYQAYLAFCQRVMLSRQAMRRQGQDHIPVRPGRWLNATNAAGYEASLPAFLFLQESRKRVPLYRAELKALAQAILEMAEEPSAPLFREWVQWFGQRRAVGELFLFTMCAAMQAYKTGGHD